MGEYQPDAQLIERTAHLRLRSLARQLFLEGLMLRAAHGEDTVAIAVEGKRDALALDDPLQQQHVAV